MIKNTFNKFKDRILTSAKEVIGKELDEQTEETISTVLSAAGVVMVAGAIFGMGQKLIPNRTNFHVYVHMR